MPIVNLANLDIWGRRGMLESSLFLGLVCVCVCDCLPSVPSVAVATLTGPKVHDSSCGYLLSLFLVLLIPFLLLLLLLMILRLSNQAKDHQKPQKSQ